MSDRKKEAHETAKTIIDAVPDDALGDLEEVLDQILKERGFDPSQFNDPPDQPPTSTPQRGGRGWLPIVLLILIVMVIVLSWYFFYYQR